MKRTFLFTMMASIIMAFSLGANAKDENNDNKKHFNPEQMVQHRAQSIAERLKLDDNTASQFIETYKEYMKEMHDVYGKFGPKREMGKPGNKQAKSDAEIEKEILNQFAMSRAIVDVREKYYKKFRKFLNPKQIKVIYSNEREHASRMKGEKMRRQPDEMHGKKPGKNRHNMGSPMTEARN